MVPPLSGAPIARCAHGRLRPRCPRCGAPVAVVRPLWCLQKYGRMAKLVIDHHRARWIRAEFGMACEVVHFADPATTLENTLLLAYPER